MKTLKVLVANRQLNALKDLLYCELNPRQKRDAEREVKKLWHGLVVAWDKPRR